MRTLKNTQVFCSKSTFVVLLLAFKVALDFSYIYLVVPYFSWTPTRYIYSPNGIKVLESYILVFIFAWLLPHKLRKPSDFLIVLFFITPILPILSLYGLMDIPGDRSFTYMIAVSFILVMVTTQILPRIKVRGLQDGPKIALFISALGIMVTLGWYITHGGLEYFKWYITLNFSGMGEIRRLATSRIFRETGLLGMLLSYIRLWAYDVFTIALAIWALFRRKYILCLILLWLEVVFSGLSASRAPLLAIPMALGTYYIVKRNALCLMIIGFLIMVVGSASLMFITNSSKLASLVIERFFFTPARVHYAYYEFFSRQNPLFFSSTHLLSLLSPVEYPFPNIPERMVGEYIFQTNTVASVGFLATAYMHLGLLGLPIFGIIVGALLKLVDSLIVGRLPKEFGLPFIVLPFYSLFTASDLTTALLSFGILPAMFLLWLFGSRKGQEGRLCSELGKCQKRKDR